jgi:hypothetical protein
MFLPHIPREAPVVQARVAGPAQALPVLRAQEMTLQFPHLKGIPAEIQDL